MLFHSAEFILLFGLVWMLYWRLPHRWQNWLLLASSYYFYAQWNWKLLFLLMATTAWDYWAARRISSAPPRKRRWWLTTSLLVNLGTLGFFKYSDFFRESLVTILTQLGVELEWRTLSIILPLGISFYTFQSISYVVDVYRGKIAAAQRLDDYALFVAFFPQLIAGPIERAGHLLPQLQNSRPYRRQEMKEGVALFIWGVWMKVLLADGLAPIVENIFTRAADGQTLTAPLAWAGAVGFAWQLYGDFAGYSLMARGLAKLLGVKLMVNFRRPFFTSSIGEFWRRWHISLSEWFKSYLYIPLGGNRRGLVITFRNLIITMTVAGLWHGAGWNFVIWGFIQGVGLAINRWLEVKGWWFSGRYHWLGSVATFVFFAVSLILFRSPDLTTAGRLFTGLVSGGADSRAALIWVRIVGLILPVLAVDCWQQKTSSRQVGLLILPRWLRWPLYAAGAYLVLFYARQEVEFIYFAF